MRNRINRLLIAGTLFFAFVACDKGNSFKTSEDIVQAFKDEGTQVTFHPKGATMIGAELGGNIIGEGFLIYIYKYEDPEMTDYKDKLPNVTGNWRYSIENYKDEVQKSMIEAVLN